MRPGVSEAEPGAAPPGQEPAGRRLSEDDKAYNQLIRGVHRVAERASCLLKATFKARRRVSLNPWRIGSDHPRGPGPAAPGTRTRRLTFTMADRGRAAGFAAGGESSAGRPPAAGRAAQRHRPARRASESAVQW
ncbi:hypothetical protein GCM10009834_33400 [Streptomonospora arabica]